MGNWQVRKNIIIVQMSRSISKWIASATVHRDPQKSERKKLNRKLQKCIFIRATFARNIHTISSKRQIWKSIFQAVYTL